MPVLAAFVVMAVDVVMGERDAVVVVTGVVLLGLTLVRQTLIVVENVSLTTDLEHRVQERTAALLRSEETLRLLIEGVADHAIFLLEPDGTIASWNAGAQRLFGWTAAEIMGADLAALDASGARAPVSLVVDACEHTIAEDEGPLRRADGTVFDATVLMTTIRAATGRIEGLVVVVRDVTERRAAERAANELAANMLQKQRLEAVGQLAGGVAHDFNNLLTVISGTASLLSDAVASGQDIDTDVAVIREAAARGAALTRQLLTFSRQGDRSTEVVDVREVVAGMEELLRRSLGESLTLKVEATTRAVPGRRRPRQDGTGAGEPGRERPRCHAPGRRRHGVGDHHAARRYPARVPRGL